MLTNTLLMILSRTLECRPNTPAKLQRNQIRVCCALADRDGILHGSVEAGVCEGNHCFTRRGCTKAKALTGTTGIRKSIWLHVYELDNGRRYTRRTSVFSRADRLEYNLDALANAYGKMMTRIGRLENRDGIVAGKHASSHAGGGERGGDAALANGAIAKDL